jgi:hypothetical protein
VKGLKETGAGLRPEEVTPGSEIANSIGFSFFLLYMFSKLQMICLQKRYARTGHGGRYYTPFGENSPTTTLSQSVHQAQARTS